LGRAEARSAQIRRPAGVTLSLQVSEYSIEPSEGRGARNLFAKDDASPFLPEVATGDNEVEEHGPKVTFVRLAKPLSGGAEGLARATSGSQRSS
jgi:hypothetical protein